MAHRISVLADYGARGAIGFPTTPPENDPTIPRSTESLYTNQAQIITTQSDKLPKSIKSSEEVKEQKELREEHPSRRVKIHTRTLIQWRAKIPPQSGEFNSSFNPQLSGTSPSGYSKENFDLEKGSTRHGRKDSRPEQSRISRSVTSASLSIAPPLATKEICLHWKVEKNENEEAIGLNFNTTLTNESPKSHLNWHHSEADNLSIQQMISIIKWASKNYRLPEDEEGLAIRLLTRVKKNAERPFIQGSFLQPYVHRYDGQHSATEEGAKRKEDTSCLFFNFPYICLQDPSNVAPASSEENSYGNSYHPMRSLLQSQFRLSDTTERDKHQSLKYLTRTVLYQHSKLTKHDMRKSGTEIKERVFVAQLWGLILGEGPVLGRTMVTYGFISETALLNSQLKLVAAELGLAIIRIRLQDQVHSFPLHECNSWFGLMKKVRGILHNAFTRVHNKDTADAGKSQHSLSKAEKRPSYLTEEYLLYLSESENSDNRTPLRSEAWAATLLKNKDKEFLDLCLRYTARDDNQEDDAEENPAEPMNGLHAVEIPEQLDSPNSEGGRKNCPLHQAQSTSTLTSSMTHTPDQTGRSGVIVGSTNTDLPPLNRRSIRISTPHSLRFTPANGNGDDMYEPFDAHIPVPKILPKESVIADVPPFLEWPILDQFGENAIITSNLSSEEIVGRFLKDLIRRCSIDLFEKAEDIATTLKIQKIGPAEITRALQTSAAYKIIKAQDSSHERVVQAEAKASDPSDGKIEAWRKLMQNCKHLLEMFVPMNNSTKGSAAVELYWGAVFSLRNTVRLTDLEELSNIVSGIIWHAGRLKAGVRRTILTDTETTSNPTQNNDQGMVLLETTVTAMKFAFLTILEAVRQAQALKGPNTSIFKSTTEAPQSEIMRLAREACENLDVAREELIGDAGCNMQEGSVSSGSIVTPERIMIIFMKRLSDGVFDEGCVEFIQLYQECLQKLTQEVEQGASRRLLKKINCFQEEVNIVEDVLTQQILVLDDFGELLNPETYSKPSNYRKERYHDELERIKLLQAEIRERLILCHELRERSLNLATRNVQLVEASADHSSRAIVIFTFITVLFLPLTFVAGIFTISGSKHEFGTVAGWTTAGVTVFCTIVAAWGEEIWLALYLLPLKITEFFKQKNKKIEYLLIN
ncbi:hypothetical protein N431DRAFT_446424 [Stipitochalara longipes BDJ]|nr:hypothetical protein N431DRAFT_446424 [Stipitochalara longipes BDJ]